MMIRFQSYISTHIESFSA